jgi:hypothetical protein
MSVPSSDYVNFAAGGSSCSYAPLGAYNADYSMGVPFQGKVTSGQYIVPTWGAIGYDSLSPKVPSCSGYYDINGAYGSNAGSCQTTYRTSLCGNPAPIPPPKPVPKPVGQDCGSLAPSQRTACCAQKQMSKKCDQSCANAKQFCS